MTRWEACSRCQVSGAREERLDRAGRRLPVAGGRAGEAGAMDLSKSLLEMGLELGRLKTGTPPRILRRSVDFSKTEVQLGDEPIPCFSHWSSELFHMERADGFGHQMPLPMPEGSMFHVEHQPGPCYPARAIGGSAAGTPPRGHQ